MGKSEDTQQLWLKRYGYIGHGALKSRRNRSKVWESTCKHSEELCESCAFGKQHRNLLPKHSNSETKQPLEVHSDVSEPMSAYSVGGSKYFVTAINEFSRYTSYNQYWFEVLGWSCRDSCINSQPQSNDQVEEEDTIRCTIWFNQKTSVDHLWSFSIAKLW